jgi:DNA-binding response OmpR family regulator
MRRVNRRLDDLVVVDPNLNDYDQLLVEILEYELRVRSFSTAEEAVKKAAAGLATLWLINFRLPDMSGIGLLMQIRRRWPRSHIVIASDVYSAEDELAARAAGATAYVCKPPTMAWLDAHELYCRLPGVRTAIQNEPGSIAALRPP